MFARNTRFDPRGVKFRNIWPPPKPVAVFIALYLVLWISCPLLLYRDPSSLFFNPTKAYELGYSAHRLEESSDYIRSALERGQTKAITSTTPDLCVGIISISRSEEDYFLKDLVGSLLSGLSEPERRRIHLVLFLAQTDISRHPAVHESWLLHVADKVVTYQDISHDNFNRMRWFESQAHEFPQKAVFDYAHILDTCYKTGAKHVVLLEDDVLALDGWFHKTLNALDTVRKETQSRKTGHYLYLRLFFTEKFFGWNSEAWPKYLFYSISSTMLVYAMAIFIHRRKTSTVPRFKRTTHISMERTILLYTILCMALLLVLFFSIGPITWFPIPHGVIEMPEFGCCSQALAFPREHIPELTTFLLSSDPYSSVESLLEQFANRHGMTRWAMNPPVLQHLGLHNFPRGDRGKVTIFNFAFENYDTKALKREHEYIVDATR